MAKAKRKLPHGEGSFYQRSSDGRWVGSIQAGWSVTGARRRIVVTDRDKSRAWDKLTAARKRVATDGATTASAPTVKAWAEDWLGILRQRIRPQSVAQHETRLRRWIIPALGARRLDRLTPADIRALHRAITDAGRDPGTVHATLSQMLKRAQADGHHVPAPVLMVERPPARAQARGAIPLEDALRLVAAAQSRPDGARWVAALLQGMRQAECLGLTWDRIDWDARTMDVSQQLVHLRREDKPPADYRVEHLIGSAHLAMPKSEAGRRIVPMVPWMWEALTRWRDVAPENPWGLVWPRVTRSGVRPTDADSDRAAWRDLCDAARVWKRAGDPPAYWLVHEARHTAASLLLAAGIRDQVVQQIMGHSSVAMTRHYQHASPESVRAALEASAESLGLALGESEL